MASTGLRGKAAKTKVKNKEPAEIQITAEQLLREAKERDLEILPPAPKQKISDPDELADYQLRKRKFYEDNIRKSRLSITNWVRYASWEESQHEIDRARSIYERAFDVDPRNIPLWLKYAEMEMKNKQINHARNVFDRAVSLLPRCNQFWYKYTYMEEMLGNIPAARQVFERWIEWEPEEQVWQTYINFEVRYKEINRAREIYSRFVYVHPSIKNWIKFARFEERNGQISKARETYEHAIEFFGDEYMDEKLFIAFAKFEENQNEHDRVKVIYQYALNRLSKDQSKELQKQFTLYEKKFGTRASIENVILNKRRMKYEEDLTKNQYDYDTWFDYIRLMEEEGNYDETRKVYEQAIANVPPKREKRYWRRYIYLWVYYALFEELETNDYDRVREIYSLCLKLIPNKLFTFAKIWLLAAKFEIRQKNLSAARKLLGTAIGLCPKVKLFREYIDLEIKLREFDRCRILYQKFIEYSPENCYSWIKFAELESLLGEKDRARGIYEIAISQPKLDMPELIWKAYIDFEIEEQEYDRTRMLYERLLERTSHVKVWISWARFELQIGADESGTNVDAESISRARELFKKANKSLQNIGDKESRLILLEAWLEFEQLHGTNSTIENVKTEMPKKVKKRRKIQAEDGSDAGWQEYYDYIFPSDQTAKPHLKLLEIAKKWKQDKPEPSTSSSLLLNASSSENIDNYE